MFCILKDQTFEFCGDEYKIINEPVHEIVGSTNLYSRCINGAGVELMVQFKSKRNEETWDYEPIVKTANLCGWGKIELKEGKTSGR
ncbi:MAG: hypothetical protein RR651_06165 [Lysinibacillus sp.]